MIIDPDFEIVNIEDESILIPVGERALSFKGVVALSETAALLIRNMSDNITREQLLNILLENYSVDPMTASEDLDDWLESLDELGLLS